MNQCFYIIASDGWVETAFDWDPTVITMLKGNIPPSQRRFDLDAKIWRIHQIAWPRMLDVFRDCGYEVPNAPANAALTMAQSGGPYAVLYVTLEAPMEVVEAAYKALARIYHPDGGSSPSHEKMLAINVARDEVRKIYEQQRKAQEVTV